MRHVTDDHLDRLEPLLVKLREIGQLAERKRGVFYWKSKSFLHFHEHEGALYADVRLSGVDFKRVRVDRAPKAKALLEAIRTHVTRRQLRARAPSARANG